jgi:hypothetical protein
VWNSTLVEDYPRVDSVIINSRARLELPPHLASQQLQHDDETVVGVVAYPDGLGKLCTTFSKYFYYLLGWTSLFIGVFVFGKSNFVLFLSCRKVMDINCSVHVFAGFFYFFTKNILSKF